MDSLKNGDKHVGKDCIVLTWCYSVTSCNCFQETIIWYKIWHYWIGNSSSLQWGRICGEDKV